MKNIYFIAIAVALTTFTNNAKAQYIHAGQHVTSDYFFDIVPDTNLQAVHNGTSPSHTMDINGDGTLDFEIRAYDAGTGTGNQNVTVIARDHNQIAVGSIDTCFDYSQFPTLTVYSLTKMAAAFNLNDSISANQQWRDTSATLCYGSWTGYNACAGNTFDLTTKYLGLRVFANSDTLYGWIKISNLGCGLNNTKVRIEEYACNVSTTSIHDNMNNLKVKIYPNPATDVLHVSADRNVACQFSLYDVSSRKIIEQKISGATSFNIKDLTKGIYFYEIQSESGLTTKGKIVKK